MKRILVAILFVLAIAGCKKEEAPKADDPAAAGTDTPVAAPVAPAPVAPKAE